MAETAGVLTAPRYAKLVKEIRQLFQELIEEVGEGEVPPITVKKHDLIMLYLELQNKKAVG